MKRYFKICLWSPIWFPAILFLVYYVGESVNGNFIDLMPESLAMIGVIVVFSLMFGGLQYLLTLALVWRRIDFNDFSSWLKWILLLPLLFTPIQVLGIWVVYGILEARFVDFNESFGLIAFDLGLAYGYVALWLFGYGVIQTYRRNYRQEAGA